MMLQSALEEEVTIYLERDYYERSAQKTGRRNGSKPRTVKVGDGDIAIRMPQVRDAGGPFHSMVLPPRMTMMQEIQEIIPLLYMNGLSTRKVKKAVGKLIGTKGLSHQNVSRMSGKIVEQFQGKEGPIGDNRCVYDLGCRTPGSTQGHTGKRGRASSLGLLGRWQPGTDWRHAGQF